MLSAGLALPSFAADYTKTDSTGTWDWFGVNIWNGASWPTNGSATNLNNGTITIADTEPSSATLSGSGNLWVTNLSILKSNILKPEGQDEISAGEFTIKASSARTLGFADGGTFTTEVDVKLDTMIKRFDVGGSPYSGTITKAGAGTLTFDGAAMSAIRGGIDVTAGSIRVTHNNRLSNQSRINLSGANTTLFLAGDFDYTMGTLKGSGTSQVVFDANKNTTRTLTINDASDGTYSGTIQDNGTTKVALAKTGTTDLSLNNAANNYSGGTTISAGRLQVDGDHALGTGNVTVGGTGQLWIRTSNNLANNIIVNGAGRLGTDGGQIRLGANNATGVVFEGGISMGSQDTKILSGGSGIRELRGVISGTGNLTFTQQSGPPQYILSGKNTYTGNTNIAGISSFTLAETGELTFSLTKGNKVIGAGTAAFNGSFAVDVAGMDVSSFAGATFVDTDVLATYGSTFGVRFFDSTDAGADLSAWTNAWTFSGGSLVAVPEASTWAALAGLIALTWVGIRRSRR